MQSHNTCHAEHKYDVAYDVLEKNHYLFFSQCRLSLLWNCVYLFKTKMLSSVFLGSFESLQERTPDEASAKTGISPNPKNQPCVPPFLVTFYPGFIFIVIRLWQLFKVTCMLLKFLYTGMQAHSELLSDSKETSVEWLRNHAKPRYACYIKNAQQHMRFGIETRHQKLNHY